jgi:hypothetical protein
MNKIVARFYLHVKKFNSKRFYKAIALRLSKTEV